MGFFDSKTTQMGMFKFPKVENERGEIERVAEEFAKDNTDAFVEEFITKAKASKMEKLDEKIWEKLQNTDSVDVEKDEWDKVKEHAGEGERDWENLKKRFEKELLVDVPMIVKVINEDREEVYHLVSGNTRLMVAKALGVTPYVLIIDMTDFGTKEE